MNAVPLNTRLLNTTKLNTIGFPVLSKRGGSSADISEAIMDSLVCWYDIAKQGATNESMAANPVLRDLSGNGHDATCYNFGWTEESGISTVNYPNALVSDGVDDYAQVTGLPILTKERGYTVVAKRKMLNETDVSSALATKTSNRNIIDGAFIFEYFDLGRNEKRTKSFNNALVLDGFEADDISWQTSKSYNGLPIPQSNDTGDTEFMNLFKIGNENVSFNQYALYSFLLFDRDLTDEEIEWVKTNLMN